DIKGGKIEFRVDKHSNLHFIIGKVSFSEEALQENFEAAVDEILRLKPSASKGRYISKAAITTSHGPAVPVDHSGLRVCSAAQRSLRAGSESFASSPDSSAALLGGRFAIRL